MTLAAISKQLNVSTMTVYRRLRKAGISLDGLRDSNGEITSAGASLIASLFDAPQDATQGAANDVTRCNSEAQRDTTQGATPPPVGEALRSAEDAAQIAVLTAQLDAACDTIARLEAERDRLVAQLDAAAEALEREQRDRANERLLLTGGGGEARQRGRGLFWWLRR